MIERLIKHKIVPSIFTKIPSSILVKLTRTNLIIPYYHMVSDNKVLHLKHLYGFKNIKQFKDDLDFLLKKFSPIGLLDLLDFLNKDRLLPDKAFLLTFDDGFREMYDIVSPILIEKGIPACFFINSAFIDNKELCYQNKASIIAEYLQKPISSMVKIKVKETLIKNGIPSKDLISGVLSITYQQRNILNEIAKIIEVDFGDYLLRNKPYLTSNNINKLLENGFTIGAHSIDHPLYSLLSLKEQLYQTLESVKLIKNKFCLDYGAFAFPHNDNDVLNTFFIELYNSGLVDVSFGTAGMVEDTVHRNIQRISLEKPLMPAERILALQFAKKLYKKTIGKNKLIREDLND